MQTKFDRIIRLNDADFRLYTGFKKESVFLMLKALQDAQTVLHKRRGCYAKLPLSDRLLMTMDYGREYRTMFHIGVDYGVSKSTVSKTICWVEDVVSKIPEFQLPGKRELQKSDMKFEVFMIDATESPIERPKRSQKKES